MSVDNPTTTPVSEVTRAIDPDTPRLLIARGQYSPNPGQSERVLILDVSSRRARALADVWWTSAQLEAATEALSRRHEVLVGECDVMFATSWKLAWGSRGGARCEVFTRAGDHLVAAQGILQRGGRAHEVAAVHVTLSDDWVRRAVEIELTDGARVEVASAIEAMATFDPTYGAFELICDASWAVRLGRALAAALGVEVTLPDALT